MNSDDPELGPDPRDLELWERDKHDKSILEFLLLGLDFSAVVLIQLDMHDAKFETSSYEAEGEVLKALARYKELVMYHLIGDTEVYIGEEDAMDDRFLGRPAEVPILKSLESEQELALWSVKEKGGVLHIRAGPPDEEDVDVRGKSEEEIADIEARKHFTIKMLRKHLGILC